MIVSKTFPLLVCAALTLALFSCNDEQEPEAANSQQSVPEAIVQEIVDSSMVSFTAYPGNPLFSGTGAATWDKKIRERGFILYDDSIFKMWYTGYAKDDEPKFLGYATSEDGIQWKRYARNPIFSDKWTEDMNVVKHNGSYYMFAEGKNDVAHLLTSADGIQWKEQGDLIIQKTNGDTIPGPYGTPAAFVEGGKWYLFYERNDEAIWVAQSTDQIHWKNINDQPVISPGPSKYDAAAIAADQVVKKDGQYYLYYHGSDDADWAKSGANSIWTSNVAISSDLLHWTKYEGNPLVEGNHSSPVTVFEGKKNRLYTMHPEVDLYLSK